MNWGRPGRLSLGNAKGGVERSNRGCQGPGGSESVRQCRCRAALPVTQGWSDNTREAASRNVVNRQWGSAERPAERRPPARQSERGLFRIRWSCRHRRSLGNAPRCDCGWIAGSVVVSPVAGTGTVARPAPRADGPCGRLGAVGSRGEEGPVGGRASTGRQRPSWSSTALSMSARAPAVSPMRRRAWARAW